MPFNSPAPIYDFDSNTNEIKKNIYNIVDLINYQISQCDW